MAASVFVPAYNAYYGGQGWTLLQTRQKCEVFFTYACSMGSYYRFLLSQQKEEIVSKVRIIREDVVLKSFLKIYVYEFYYFIIYTVFHEEFLW